MSGTSKMLFNTATACLILAATTSIAATEEPVNTGPFGGVAIKGYDTVAYFTEHRAVKGSSDFAYEWLGTPWYFASDHNRKLFEADPVRYAPQYGGYCTLGVGFDSHASENIDPERAWRIIDDKLYFVSDPTGADMLDGPAQGDILAKAEGNWPEVKTELEEDFSN